MQCYFHIFKYQNIHCNIILFKIEYDINLINIHHKNSSNAYFIISVHKKLLKKNEYAK